MALFQSGKHDMRIRFKTKTLLIITALMTLPALHYRLFVRQHQNETKALADLLENGFSYSKRTEPVEYSKNGFTNRAIVILNWPVGMVFGDEYLKRVVSIDISVAPGERGSLEPLTKLKHLRYLTFDSQTEEEVLDDYVDTLVTIESLESISLFIDQINVASYRRLTAAGISVDHYGVRDFKLDDNYLYNGERFFPVDLENSSVRVGLAAGDLGVSFSIDVTTKDPLPIFLMPEPSFNTITVKTVGRLHDIVGSGKVFKSKGQFNDGSNYYDGIHEGLLNHSLELISFADQKLRLKWKFEIEDSGPGPFVDVELPVKKVVVTLGLTETNGKLVEEQSELAKVLLSQHFDPDTFAAPVYSKSSDETVVRFNFKAKE